VILTVDIGNTNIRIAGFDGEEITFCLTLPARKRLELKQLRRKAPPDAVKHIGIGSVNPPVCKSIIAALRRIYSAKPLVIGKDLNIPMPVRCRKPERVGTDRLLNALAAYHKYGGTTVIVDMGSAITVDVVSARGEFLGGTISAGLKLSALALHDHTALLPLIDPCKTSNIIGKDTIEAMTAGVFWSTVGGVERILSRIEKRYRVRKVIATGGDAPLLAKYIDGISTVEPYLTLEGIALLLRQGE